MSKTTASTAKKQFKENAQGYLIPVDRIKEIDLARDELVIEIMQEVEAIAETVADFKRSKLRDLQAFVEISAEKYGAKIGGKQGNLSLCSFDGRYEIKRAIAKNIKFDERLQAAKSLIDECLNEWTADSRSEIQTIIQSAFDTDHQGNVNTRAVLELRKHKFEDPKWVQAMEAIADSITVTGSKTYLRFYKKSEDGSMIQISLDPTEL